MHNKTNAIKTCIYEIIQFKTILKKTECVDRSNLLVCEHLLPLKNDHHGNVLVYVGFCGPQKIQPARKSLGGAKVINNKTNAKETAFI